MSRQTTDFAITFPPENDGCLLVRSIPEEHSVEFRLHFNRHPEETPRACFLRMCKEVAEKGV